MVRKSFAARIDERVLDIAHRLAAAENLSVTTLVEMAILQYAAQRGVPIPNPIEIKARFITAGTGKMPVTPTSHLSQTTAPIAQLRPSKREGSPKENEGFQVISRYTGCSQSRRCADLTVCGQLERVLALAVVATVNRASIRHLALSAILMVGNGWSGEDRRADILMRINQERKITNRGVI